MKRDLPFKFDQSSDLGRWRAETFWDKEPETIAWVESFRELSQENLDFIDVGANLGIYSLFALNTGAYGRIIAIEPMPLNFKTLKQNVTLNGFEEQAILYNQPLYSWSLIANFEYNDVRVGSSGGQVIENLSGDEANKETMVQCLTGDMVIQSNLVKSCVVKLDVDGLELEILRGFENSFSTGVIQGVLVEATTQNSEEIIQFMGKYAFFIDTRFDAIDNHSTKRREISGSFERNIIFSKHTIDS